MLQFWDIIKMQKRGKLAGIAGSAFTLHCKPLIDLVEQH
jgi:hypothetical protein